MIQATDERWNFEGEPVPVESSMLRAVRYDPAGRVLEVVFRNGRPYHFVNVPPDEYDHLLKASSRGRYFLNHIRDVYPYWRFHGARRRAV